MAKITDTEFEGDGNVSHNNPGYRGRPITPAEFRQMLVESDPADSGSGADVVSSREA